MSQLARAQTSEPRRQIGASYSALGLEYPDQTRSGVGAFFAYDFSDFVGLDTEFTVFPTDDPVARRTSQMLLGARTSVRRERFAIVGRVRPGLIHFSERFFAPGIVCIAIFPPPEACLAKQTNFALDIGGALELFPTQQTVLRIGFGGVLIRFARDGLDPEWTRNRQVSAGAGLRF